MKSDAKRTADGIPVFCAFDEIAPTASIIGNPRNPNMHPEKQLKMLASIIDAQGWRAPITVSNRSGFVVRGHGRLAAAILLGKSEVPVDRQDYADEASEWADMIADNRLAELSEIDDNVLAGLMDDIDLSGLDIELTGFDAKAANRMTNQLTAGVVEDEPPAPESNPTARRGDLYHLGDHRLLCGDSTLEADVTRLMAGEIADAVFIDPPYNVAYEDAAGLSIMNDSMSEAAFETFLTAAYERLFEVTKAGGAIYVCHSDTAGDAFRIKLREAGWLLKQCLIWVKQTPVLSRQDYNWAHEPILYGWKPGAAHVWSGTFSHSTIFEQPIDLDALPKPKLVQMLRDLLEQSTALREDRPMRAGAHPTMKPIALVARCIMNNTLRGEIVVDTFGGSGSTLMASEQTGRRCFTMELDPVYVDVIVRRWESFTGGEAVLERA